MIFSLLAAALIQSAAAGPFVDRLLIDIAREHAPWRYAPLVFLTDADDGLSCGRALMDFATSAPDPTFELDGQFIRNSTDIWRFAGAKHGYAGLEQPTPFVRFARTTPRGFILTKTATNSWGAQLIADWFGDVLKNGPYDSNHGPVDVGHLVVLFEMPIYTQLTAKVSIQDLSKYAVAEATLEGCTYAVINRLRARAQLGCTAALVNPAP